MSISSYFCWSIIYYRSNGRFQGTAPIRYWRCSKCVNDKSKRESRSRPEWNYLTLASICVLISDSFLIILVGCVLHVKCFLILASIGIDYKYFVVPSVVDPALKCSCGYSPDVARTRFRTRIRHIQAFCFPSSCRLLRMPYVERSTRFSLPLSGLCITKDLIWARTIASSESK